MENVSFLRHHLEMLIKDNRGDLSLYLLKLILHWLLKLCLEVKVENSMSGLWDLEKVPRQLSPKIIIYQRNQNKLPRTICKVDNQLNLLLVLMTLLKIVMNQMENPIGCFKHSTKVLNWQVKRKLLK
jgi:hypothetical protein